MQDGTLKRGCTLHNLGSDKAHLLGPQGEHVAFVWWSEVVHVQATYRSIEAHISPYDLNRVGGMDPKKN